MKRKVKIFTSSKASGFDKVINGWIEESGFELLDVRVVCNTDAKYRLVHYTATVICTDRTERKQNNGRN